jgi:hypothetical protein
MASACVKAYEHELQPRKLNRFALATSGSATLHAALDECE